MVPLLVHQKRSHISYTNSNKIIAHTHTYIAHTHSHPKWRFYLTLICPVMNWHQRVVHWNATVIYNQSLYKKAVGPHVEVKEA